MPYQADSSPALALREPFAEGNRDPANYDYANSARRLVVNYEQIDWDNLSEARHQTDLAKVTLVVEFVRELLQGGSGKEHSSLITGT
jgi:hypothetical protein